MLILRYSIGSFSGSTECPLYKNWALSEDEHQKSQAIFEKCLYSLFMKWDYFPASDLLKSVLGYSKHPSIC